MHITQKSFLSTLFHSHFSLMWEQTKMWEQELEHKAGVQGVIILGNGGGGFGSDEK